MPSLPESISSLRTLDTRISRIERISADDVEGMWPSDHTRDSNQYRHFELKTTVPIRVNPPNLRDPRVRRSERACATVRLPVLAGKCNFGPPVTWKSSYAWHADPPSRGLESRRCSDSRRQRRQRCDRDAG